MGKPMKPRLLDAMGEALSLVRQSNLAEATVLLRRALSGEEPKARASDLDAESPSPPYSDVALPVRRPLGEVLRVLRSRPAMPPGAPPAPEAEPERALGERFARRVYRGPAGSLAYRLYVPPSHAPRDLALVLMLHGCTQNPEDFAVGTQMNSVADEFGFIVAYPHQPRRANVSGCWNWFDRRHQDRGAGEPAKLAGLAQALAKEFGVGANRIFAAGLSAGGAMAEILSATYPDVFEAVGIHSGLPYKSAVDVPSAFAAMKGTSAAQAPSAAAIDRRCRKIVIHGGADATVNSVNGDRILAESERGPDPLVRAELDWDITGGRVSRTVLRDPEGRVVVEHWLVEGGGHAWFGGDPRGSYTQTVGLDASRVMARFFLRQ
jgi:poly(hydroxyalkanoate) depolymerase family esterase